VELRKTYLILGVVGQFILFLHTIRYIFLPYTWTNIKIWKFDFNIMKFCLPLTLDICYTSEKSYHLLARRSVAISVCSRHEGYLHSDEYNHLYLIISLCFYILCSSNFVGLCS
jgi:hypothetical protein